MFLEAIYLGPVMIAVCVMVVLAIHPVMRLLNFWWIDRTMPGWHLVVWLVGYLSLLLIFLNAGWLLALAYLIAVNIYWICEPKLTYRRCQRLIEARVGDEIRRLGQMVAANPEVAPYHTALANAYMEHGRYDEAIAEYEMAIALLPGHSREEQYKLQHARTARESRLERER